ncbi:30S ribosomal protein S6 [Candidatus Kaiserbacteria bacterium]|nr:30S ribosomal protein S6 [Candidatus Kaiserbacteria bacterium]
MAEKTMPAAEAAQYADEKNSYEFAFHVLPTVAEGEVAGVFESLKGLITAAGAEIFDEEAPEHLDLAYDIEKDIEGTYRRFHSAYFGWIRFRTEGSLLETLTEEIEARPEILRHLIVKLTKVEEANPFRYHEAQKANKKVTDVEVEDSSEEKDSDEVSKEEEKG